MKIDFSALNEYLSYQMTAAKILVQQDLIEESEFVTIQDHILALQKFNNDIMNDYGTEILDTVTLKSVTKHEFYSSFLPNKESST